MTILLADESFSVRASLGKVLLGAGYDVIMACSGAEALRIISRHRIDLLLLDLDMPEMDGWQTMEALAQEHPSLPVIIITGQPDEREWARSRGACGLMEKPLEIPQLLRALEEIRPAVNSRRVHAPDPARPVFRYSPPSRFDFRLAVPKPQP